MLLASTTTRFQEEWHYTMALLLGDFLGIPWKQSDVAKDEGFTVVEFQGRRLRIADIFFHTPQREWLTPASLPKKKRTYSIPTWLGIETTHQDIPAFFGLELPEIASQDSNQQITINGDLLGSAFFLLSRYEEVADGGRDKHGRFPYLQSASSRFGTISRALVDEYVEVVFAAVQRLWPSLDFVRPARNYELRLSHDIDFLFYFRNWNWRDAIKRSLKTFVANPASREACKWLWRDNRRKNADPFNNLDYIMRQSEQRDLRSAFYFISSNNKPSIDGDYCIEEPVVRSLIHEISERGHEVGIHPSYSSYNSSDAIRTEFHRLLDLGKTLGITQSKWGGRQHYLRWDQAITPAYWEEADLQYDSTLGFPEHIGFRCGTCQEYQLYDLKNRRQLRLRERPLHVMDVSVIDKPYMDLGHGDKALSAIRDIKSTCRRFGGQFNLLWHNTRLVNAKQRALYEAVLDA